MTKADFNFYSSLQQPVESLPGHLSWKLEFHKDIHTTLNYIIYQENKFKFYKNCIGTDFENVTDKNNRFLSSCGAL
jgi:hypothetical protein